MHATPLDAGRELLELFEEGRETLELLEGALLLLLQGAFEGGQGDVGSLQVAGGVCSAATSACIFNMHLCNFERHS